MDKSEAKMDKSRGNFEPEKGDMLIADTGGIARMKSGNSYEILHGPFPVSLMSGFVEKDEGIWKLGFSMERVVVVLNEKLSVVYMGDGGESFTSLSQWVVVN